MKYTILLITFLYLSHTTPMAISMFNYNSVGVGKNAQYTQPTIGGGQIKGATAPPVNKTTAPAPKAPAPTPAPTPMNQNKGSSGGQPQETQRYAAPDGTNYQGDQNSYMSEIDNTFRSVMDSLSANEALLGNAKTAAEQQAQAEFEANQSLLGTQKNEAISSLDAQFQQGEAKKEDALNQARRLYQQLSTGASQRFGARSGAAQGASEILGNQLQSQMGQTNRQGAQFMQDIETAKKTVNEKFDAGVFQLAQSFQGAKAKIQQDFLSAIMQINNQRAASEQEKGMARLNALKSVRDQVNQVKNQEVAFNQQLQAMREQNLLQIDAYKQTTGQSLASANNAQENFNPSYDNFSRLQSGQTLAEPQYVGKIGKSVTGKDKYGNYTYSDGTSGPGGFMQG